MALTAETLARHELAGLPVRIVDGDDPGRVGIEGCVLSETTDTLRIAPDSEGSDRSDSPDRPGSADESSERVVTVPKAGTTFEFELTAEGELCASGPAGAADATAEESGDGERTDETVRVTVDGSRLVARPARRTETSGDSPWQQD